MRKSSTRCTLQICCIVAAVSAALIVTLSDQHVAYSQGGDDDYVDVSLTLEIPNVDAKFVHSIDIVVENKGDRPAYDVEVVLEVESPEKSHFRNGSQPPVGTVLFGDDVPWDDQGAGRSLRWIIPELGGKQREVFNTGVTHKVPSGATPPPPLFDNETYVHAFSGRVTTSSFESNLHKGNNTSRVWSYEYDESTAWHRWFQLWGNYAVDASVDNPSPTPGETVNFTIIGAIHRTFHRLINVTLRSPPPVDAEVSIELTDGLTVDSAETISYAPDGATGLSYNDGVFNIGTQQVEVTGDVARSYSVTLPVRVDSSAAVNEQCLTATITGNPPPGSSPFADDITDNVVEVCLGQLSNPLLNSQVDEFNVYPCVGNTDSPCDSADDVRVRAVSNAKILGSGRTLIHVPAQTNREYDSHKNSVNAGTVVSWQFPVTWDASELDAVHAQWKLFRDSFTARGVHDATPPGKVHVRAWELPDFELIYKMTSETGWTDEDSEGFPPVSFIDGGNGPDEYNAEFEKLGTYELDYTAKLTPNTRDGDEDCDPNTDDPPLNQSFCATETYTFHLGPMAELTVEDGGASSRVPANRNTLAIVAVNNGPDEPSGGARITGLPTGAEVIHISHGSYNSSTGVWNIDRLRVRGYYRSAGMSEPTLVLDASAGDTANVSIASAKDYEVCVGPKDNPGNLDHTTQAACEAVTDASWNSVPVYDYKPHNNSATISARAGTGAALISMPETEAIAAIRVTWDPVTEVNGREVTHYEVQRRTNPWETVAKVLDPVYHELVDDLDDDSDPVAVEYLDWNVELGDIHEYRIRAVNDQDYNGPWSSSVEGMVPLPPEPPEPPAVVRPPITEPTRILRIEPSITDVSLKGGSVVRLAVEVYGRQDLRDDSLGDRSDVTFDWTLEEFGHSRAAPPAGWWGTSRVTTIAPGSVSSTADAFCTSRRTAQVDSASPSAWIPVQSASRSRASRRRKRRRNVARRFSKSLRVALGKSKPQRWTRATLWERYHSSWRTPTDCSTRCSRRLAAVRSSTSRHR